jgi:outer membrane protein TolC
MPLARGGEPEKRQDLTLVAFLQMVLERNDTIQAQLLGTEASRRRLQAEYGVFETELAGSAQRVRNKRPNTVEQQRNLAGIPILDERNNLYDAGLENLLPTGAKVRLGYTLSDLTNNLGPGKFINPNDPAAGTTGSTKINQYQSFAGLTASQPLLKNGGTAATLANIRLAAINSEAAFQEYRRQLMVTISQAESAYWALYFAQEQLRFVDDSVSVAESIFRDSREKVKAGKGSDLDVMEAESALALRRTKRNEALQRYSDALGQMLTFAGSSPLETRIAYRAVDRPDRADVLTSYDESTRLALDLNPDYLIQRKKVDEALVRLAVARNQALPELNLKGSYGFNGLGDTPGDAWNDIESGGFTSWSAGVEFRLPLLGGIRGRNETAASRLTLLQTKLQLQGLETQIGNAINTAIGKVQTTRASAGDYGTMIRFNENLLATQRARLDVGKIEARRVLEAEADLFEVRQNLVDSLVQFQRAILELHLAEGSVLMRRNLDFDAKQLREGTQALLRPRKPAPKAVAVPAKEPSKPHLRFVPTELQLRE